MLALPAGVTCPDVAGAAGLAEVGGNHVWINGSFEVPVLAHELGHNLGLSHAGGLQCTHAGSAGPLGSVLLGDRVRVRGPVRRDGQQSDPGCSAR